jgi:hypothetical protein
MIVLSANATIETPINYKKGGPNANEYEENQESKNHESFSIASRFNGGNQS